MPSGMMIPSINTSPATGRSGRDAEFGSSSGLTLRQPNLMEDEQNQQEMAANINSAESEFDKNKDDDLDSKSGSDNEEGASGDELDVNQRPQKKRYHRHTQNQIQEMETFFRDCPHPDDKQRKELSRVLGLEPLQIKFWFQNKRTQMKNQQERHENSQLRSENERLRVENMRYKEALANTSCPTCGGPTNIGEISLDEHNLKFENAKLREEIDRISSVAAKHLGRPVPQPLPHIDQHPLDLGVGNIGGDMLGVNDYLRPMSSSNEGDKQMIIELAVASMEELVRMTQTGEPLWTLGMDNATYILNEEEYLRTFSRGIGLKPISMKSEASRETALVIMNPINLVEILMDVNQWSNMFSGIISRATTLEVLSTGVAGNYNGALQVMTAEFQISSPLVPVRESVYIRYCKQHPASGNWAVVDVSLDLVRPNPASRYRRRPSGCLIQEMPNGYSKVVWVEHVEVDDSGIHNVCKSFVYSGLAFGAKRWVSILERRCERLASVMASNIPAEVGVITSQEGRRSILKLAERMVTSYYSGVGASTAPTWTIVSGNGADDMRIMTRKSVDDPGRPTGNVICASISFWLAVPPMRFFECVLDLNSRNKWDILSNGGDIQEIAHIANGRDPGNSVSLLRVNSANLSQNNMLIIQETSTDSTGSYVVYAPVDIVAMNVVLNGGDADYVAILPSGFAIIPDGPITHGGGIIDVGRGGTVLTVAFQVLVDQLPTAKVSLGSIATVSNLLDSTVDRVKAMFTYQNA